MAYCTRADVENAVGGAARLVQLLDRNGDGTEDSTVVDEAIVEADALIDSYAQKRFAVPFATATTTIKKLSARLARFELRSQNNCVSASDQLVHDADVKWLEALSKGEVLPGGDVIPPKSPIVNDRVSSVPSMRDVSRNKLKGYS